MSNKNLVTIIVGILLVGIAIGGYIYWYQTKPLVVSQKEIQDAIPKNAPESNLTVSGNNNKTTMSTPTPTPNGQCVRNFDQAKLSKNSAINIQNRTVEINVKGFGKIQLQFYPKDAPKTVENFLRLVDSGYYDCITFHRVSKGFVIQGGDPNGNGTGGVSAFGSAFADELNPETQSYKTGYVKGVLAMANSGPNTNGSQFFIMLSDTPLPNAYTIFGKVSSGQSVVDKIGQVEITPMMGPTDGAPKKPVVMQSVKIIK